MDIETKIVRQDMDNPTIGSFMDLEYVLHCIEKGEMIYRNEQSEFAVISGDVILIPPKTLHAVSDLKGISMTVVHFLDHTHTLEAFRLPQVVHCPDEDFERILGITESLRSYWSDAAKETRIICNGLTQTLIGLFLRLSLDAGKERDSKAMFQSWESIKMSVEYIHAHFQDPDLSVLEVSRHSGLSYNYFSALFSKYTNENPISYINHVRIEHAKNILFNHQGNVTEAAYTSGFRSLAYFSKTFKKKEGLSPNNWLKETL